MVKNRIATLREEMGITQAELAHRADIRVGTLSDIETGKGNPRLSTLDAIALGLGVTVLELFSEEGGDAEISRLLIGWRKLPEAEKQAILTLLGTR